MFHSKVKVDYVKLPLHFEENKGQADPQVRFYSSGSGFNLFLTASDAVLSLSKADGGADLRIKLLGANPGPQVRGIEELLGKVNYFIGGPSVYVVGAMPEYGYSITFDTAGNTDVTDRKAVFPPGGNSLKVAGSKMDFASVEMKPWR